MQQVDHEMQVKRCPRCAEDVRLEATRCRHCHFELVDPPSGELIRQWIRANPTLTASLATFLYVVFQIYKSGDFEVNTTIELLRAGGLTSILLGVLLAQLPIELALINLVCCWWLIAVTPAGQVGKVPSESGLRTRLATNDPRTTPFVLLGALLVLSFYSSPWPYFLSSLLLSMVTGTIALRRNNRSRPAGTYTRRLITVFIFAAFLLLLQRPTTWTPSERVTTIDQGTIVGYVIADDERWTTILTPRSTGKLSPGENSVRRISTQQITDRQPCALEFIETRLFPPALRFRSVQIIEVVNKKALPQPLTPPCP
jgi:hypothetical protein